jgi:Rod binding domain-containing protein
MDIGAIDTTVWGAGARRAAVDPRGDGSFDAMLRAGVRTGPVAEKADKVRAAAEEFVSMTLVEPVMARMRAMNMAAEPFAPGAHEKAFAPLIDAAWSQGIVKASGWGLVDRVEQWMRQREATKTEVRDG